MRSLHCFVMFLLVAGALPPDLAAADDAAPPRNYVLYMGTDLFVQHGKELYRVEDVDGSDFRINVGGREVFVPTKRSPVKLHVDAELKLAGLSVQLDELKAGAGYTYDNDPIRQLQEANRNQMVTQDMQDVADAAVTRNELNLANVKEMTRNYPSAPGVQERIQREVAAAQVQLDQSVHTVDYTTISRTSDSSQLGSGANRMALAQGNFDAMEVSFKVSSPVELKHPHMVILFRFHDPAAKPGVNGMAIHAQALDPIDAKPRYVRVLRGGLPPGFQYVDCEVHIFERSREVATNQSGQRVELAGSEARLYLVMNHVGAHKDATLPATAVPGMLLPSWREGLTSAQLSQTFYAKVAGDGSLQGVFKDPDCKEPVEDAGTTAVLDKVFFLPALEEGRPVDGVARVRLSDL